MNNEYRESRYDWMRRAESKAADVLKKAGGSGEFTDDDARNFLEAFKKSAQMAADTQAAIIKYAEPMAQVLAEAGRASQHITGDTPHAAIEKWLSVIRDRAHEILREKCTAPSGTRSETSTSSLPNPNATSSSQPQAALEHQVQPTGSPVIGGTSSPSK